MNQRGWMMLTAGLTAVLGAAWWFASRPVEPVPLAPEAPIAPVRSPSVAAPAPRVVEAPVPEAALALAAPVEAEQPVIAEPVAAPVRGSLGTPRPSKHPIDPRQLEQANALLAQVKELVRSDPKLALRHIDAHRQQLGEAGLEKDATLVRVEAYLRLGQRDDAEALGKKLSGKDPSARKAVAKILSEVKAN